MDGASLRRPNARMMAQNPTAVAAGRRPDQAVPLRSVARDDSPPSCRRWVERSDDRVDVRWLTVHRIHVGAIEACAELRRNPDRTMIVWRNEADDTVDVRVVPRPAKCGARRFRCQSVAPPGSVNHPAKIDTRPRPLRVVQADTADHVAGRLLDDSPLAIAPGFPLAAHVAGVLQGQIVAAGRLVERDLFPLYDLRIPHHVHERLCVGQFGYPKTQACGFDELDWRAHRIGQLIRRIMAVSAIATRFSRWQLMIPPAAVGCKRRLGRSLV